MKWLTLIPLLFLSPQDPIFRSDVSLVRVDAQVTEGLGSVAGLQGGDFVVKDNDRLQPLRYCTQDEDALDLMLLFDISGSMQPSIRRVAAEGRMAMRELRAGDRVAVADFNTDGFLLAGFTDDLKIAASNVDRVVDLRFGGGTHILSSIRQAADYFRSKGDPHRRRAILIITDNLAINHLLPDDVVIRELYRAETSLNAIVVGRAIRPGSQPGTGHDAEATPADVYHLAEETGGDVIHAESSEEAFRTMIERIRFRYTLAYHAPRAVPGSFRRIHVELSPDARRRFPTAVLRARTGYYAAT